MRSQPVELLDFVEDDLRYARSFYDSWQFEGAKKFHEKLRQVVEWIEWNPESFPRKYRFYRRAIIRRSYFGVYFVIEPKVTTIVAVLDMRSDPRVIRAVLGLRRKTP